MNDDPSSHYPGKVIPTTHELFERDLKRAQEIVNERRAHLTIYKDFTFEASHVLPKHPGKCSRLHGHSWQLRVGVRGPVNKESGFVLDYAVMKDVVMKGVIDLVDHQHLGHGSAASQFLGTWYQAALGDDLYPTSENLINAFRHMLSPLFAEKGVELTYLELKETCTSGCIWQKYGH